MEHVPFLPLATKAEFLARKEYKSHSIVQNTDAVHIKDSQTCYSRSRGIQQAIVAVLRWQAWHAGARVHPAVLEPGRGDPRQA